MGRRIICVFWSCHFPQAMTVWHKFEILGHCAVLLQGLIRLYFKYLDLNRQLHIHTYYCCVLSILLTILIYHLSLGLWFVYAEGHHRVSTRYSKGSPYWTWKHQKQSLKCFRMCVRSLFNNCCVTYIFYVFVYRLSSIWTIHPLFSIIITRKVCIFLLAFS